MVIKTETVEMAETVKTEPATVAAEEVIPSEGLGSSLTPPPSKRPRLNPPLHAAATGSFDAMSTLQSTLSTVIGTLSAQQLETLSSLISSISADSSLNNTGTVSAIPDTTVNYKCDFCSDEFASSSDYFKHITFSHESDCVLCYKSFKTQLELSKHITSVHSGGSKGNATSARHEVSSTAQKTADPYESSTGQFFKCEICEEMFGSHQSLEQHLKLLHDDHKPHSCFVCKEAFATPSQLYKHISFTHDLDCTYCQKTCTSAIELKNHMIKEHSFECVVCKAEGMTKVFNSLSSYDIHLEHYHDNMEIYKCISCSGRFTSLPDFQTHVMEVHQAQPDDVGVMTTTGNSEVPVKYPCPICEENLADADSLHTHVKEQHTGFCVFCEQVLPVNELSAHVYQNHQRQCEICEVVFRAEYLVCEHFKSVHPEMKITPCLYCDKAFITAHQIVSHMNTRHVDELSLAVVPATPAKEKAISCSLCDFTVDNVLDLQSHIRKSHDTRCGACERIFSTVRDLDIHIYLDHYHVCNTCRKSFSQRRSLRTHIKDSHPEVEIHPCRICDAFFSKRDELVDHVTDHITPVTVAPASTSRSAFGCILCEGKFPNKKNLNEHLAREHKMLHSCDICSNCFVSESALYKHIEVYHDNIVFFNCNKCTKKTLSKPELALHIEQNHKDDYEYTKCTLCEEKFTNQSDYFKHISFAHDSGALPEAEQQGKCSQCQAVFITDSALAEHQIKVHAKNKYFQCKICSVKFTSYYRLNRHTKSVHSGSEYSCDICNKSYHTTQALYRHQKSYHEAELGVKICLTCGARLNSAAALKEHVTQHFNSKEICCHQCDVSFSSMAALNDHVLFHKKEDYKCVDCSRTFSSQAELKVHVSSDHVGMVMCPKCDEAFETEALLSVHRQLHHEKGAANNYRCMDCGKCFDTSSELKVHVTLKHLGQSANESDNLKYTCIDCSEKFDEKNALKAHISLKHGGTNTCNECLGIFPTAEALANHDCDIRKHACKQCHMKFKLKSELEEHMISHVSINVNDQYCTLCNKQFSSVSEKDEHSCTKDKAENSSSSGNHDNVMGGSTTTNSNLSQMLSYLENISGSNLSQSPQTAAIPMSSKSMVSPAKATTKAHLSSQLLSVLSLVNRLAAGQDVLSQALNDFSSQNLAELIANLNSGTDLISTLARNPPKLPDTLIPEPSRASPTLRNFTETSVKSNKHRLTPEQNQLLLNKNQQSKIIIGKDGFPEPIPVSSIEKALPAPIKTKPQTVSPRPETASSSGDTIKCARCGIKFESKQLLAEHLQTCSTPKPTSTSPQKQPKGKPDLKLIHRQLFIAAQNTDVSLLNIQQVETLIQVLASEDGIKRVSQERVIDLLDAIEKSVKLKEAREREAKRSSKQGGRTSVSALPHSTSNSPVPLESPLRGGSLTGSPNRTNQPHTSPIPPLRSSGSPQRRASPKPPSLTDCLPPEITAAILPAIKEEAVNEVLLQKITLLMEQCSVKLGGSVEEILMRSITRSIQILQHPNSTNQNTLSQLKSIILSILGPNSSSEKSLKQGMTNVLKRMHKSGKLKFPNFGELEVYLAFFVEKVLPTLDNLSQNLLTLPFLLDLVLKNDKGV